MAPSCPPPCCRIRRAHVRRLSPPSLSVPQQPTQISTPFTKIHTKLLTMLAITSLLILQTICLQTALVCGTLVPSPAKPTPTPQHTLLPVDVQTVTLGEPTLPQTPPPRPAQEANGERDPSLDLRDLDRGNSAAPEPETTAGPELSGDAAALRFVQTTYTTCVTFPNSVHCGVHKPILDASSSAVSCWRRKSLGAVAIVAMTAVLMLVV